MQNLRCQFFSEFCVPKGKNY